MKVMHVVALFGILVAGSAFAQSNPAPGNAAQVASSSATAPCASPNTNWVAPYGQPVAEKTRAQVYQELIQAEQDGQLAYLNSTVYAHS